MHPVSQLLQEYDELNELRADLSQLTGVHAPRTIQMLFRLGYAQQTAPSPRRRVEEFIK